MDTVIVTPRFLMAALGLALGSGLAAVAFAGWVYYGADIVLSLSESGLSFCF